MPDTTPEPTPRELEAIAIVHAAQQILARYLPPDGITAEIAIDELLKVLDSRDAAALTIHLRDA